MPKLLNISEKRLIHKIPASREMKECQRLMPGQEKIPSAGMSRCHCHALQALRAMAPSAGPVCCGVATTQENENILTINELYITLLEIGAKKSIANDRQIFPLFPDLIDIVTHLIVIYLFHFLHFPTSNTVVYGYKSTK